tara:strand:+ start:304 stop:1329 length:1026 start_codon:yes stop_codon:yes gene_type:complete
MSSVPEMESLPFQGNTKRFSEEFYTEDHHPTNHKDVCICMIDIVNFSKWCNNKEPETIFDTMTAYNTFLSEYISEFDDLRKIELVGDSVLIVAGFNDAYAVNIRVKNMIALSTQILSNIETIYSMFDSDTSLRIGVHVGDIYSGFIENPRKFQLFGNSINVASRLEQFSLPGTFTISETAHRFYIDKMDPSESILNETLHFGPPLITYLKGVGNMGCITGYLKKNKVLISDDDELCMLTLRRVVDLKYNIDSILINDINTAIEHMKKYQFKLCIIDIYFANITSFCNLREFRNWEHIHRRSKQKIILASSSINTDTMQLYDDIVDGFMNKKDLFNLDKLPD